eukprot:Skav209787  [mRNA]  locus=scaffold9:677194:678909:- [translate_table: standard]
MVVPVFGLRPCEKSSSNSRAGKFLESDTRQFCERNGISLLVRSHEVPRTADITRSNSSPALEAFEHWAPPWPQLCSLLGPEGLRGTAAAERQRLAEQWEKSLGGALGALVGATSS